MTTEKKTVADHFPGKTSDEIADILTNKDFQAEEEARKTAGQKAVEHALDPERTPEDMEALDLEVENRKLPPTGPRVSLRPAFPPWDPPVVPFTKEQILRGRVRVPGILLKTAPGTADPTGADLEAKKALIETLKKELDELDYAPRMVVLVGTNDEGLMLSKFCRVLLDGKPVGALEGFKLEACAKDTIVTATLGSCFLPSGWAGKLEDVSSERLNPEAEKVLHENLEDMYLDGQTHYSAPKGAGKDGPRIVGKVVDGKMVLNEGEERNGCPWHWNECPSNCRGRG